MIEIKDNSLQIAAAIDRINQAASNPGPLMGIIAEIMFDEVEENFAQEGIVGTFEPLRQHDPMIIRQ